MGMGEGRKRGIGMGKYIGERCVGGAKCSVLQGFVGYFTVYFHTTMSIFICTYLQCIADRLRCAQPPPPPLPSGPVVMGLLPVGQCDPLTTAIGV